MTVIYLLFMNIISAVQQGVDSPSLVAKVNIILGVSDPLVIGTKGFNQAAFTSLNSLGERKEVLEAIISRANDLEVGVELSNFGSHALLHWMNEEAGVVVRIGVQIVFDQNRRVKDVSTSIERRPAPPKLKGVETSTGPLVDPSAKKQRP